MPDALKIADMLRAAGFGGRRARIVAPESRTKMNFGALSLPVAAAFVKLFFG